MNKTLPDYQSIAQDFLEMIRRGAYGPGDRLPSIRELAQQTGKSINTIKGAYQHLERSGAVYPVPGSGYFVDAGFLRTEKSKKPSSDPIPLEDSSLEEFYNQVMEEMMDTRHVGFGCAGPDSSQLPLKKIETTTQEILRSGNQDWLKYSPPSGFLSLRKAIARQLWHSGITVSAQDILITNGCMEAIYLSLRAVTNSGDTILLETPLYFNFLFMLKSLGLRILEVPRDPEKGISLELLDYLIQSSSPRAMITVSNFSNPQGSVLPDENKAALVELLENRGVALIEDDIYGDLSHTGERPRVCKCWDTTDNVLLCSSFSKVLGTGLRIGYVVSSRHRETLKRSKMTMNIATASLPQLILARFLEEGTLGRHIRRLSAELKESSANMRADILDCFPEGTRVSSPRGGYLLWVELPMIYRSSDIFQKAATLGISLTPGSLFSLSGDFEHCVRLNTGDYGITRREALRALGKMICELNPGA